MPENQILSYCISIMGCYDFALLCMGCNFVEHSYLGSDTVYLMMFNHLDSSKFPREMFSEEVQQVPKNAPPPVGPLSIVLNSEETMYSQLRDLNFGAVGAFLSKKAKEISAAFEVRKLS